MAGAVTLPPPPYATSLVDKNGVMTAIWNQWFQQMYARIGAQSALTNVSLTQTAASQALSSVYVGAGFNNIYTSPVGQSTIIDTFVAKNNDTVSQTLSVYLVPVGATPSTSNLAVNQILLAGQSLSIVSLQNSSLGGGGYISCSATAPSVIVTTVTGRQVS